jgi:GNAT superfamily N-acetyltransferase
MGELLKLVTELFGDKESENFLSELVEHPKPTIFMALDELQMAGFKAGYAKSRNEYFSWMGGVREEYRNRGIAKELMRRQHQWVAEQGFHKVETKAKNDSKGMLVLDIKFGFDVVGSYTDETGEAKIILKKELVLQ